MTKKILISACFLGYKVRFDGKDNLHDHPRLHKLIQKGCVISICPEVAGGLSTPRPPAEIKGDRVITTTEKDVTNEYQQGAQKALKLATHHGIKVALLKAKSPSCGNTHIYDGTFSRTLKEGMGITAKLLTDHGIRVFNETQIDEALDYLDAQT